MPHAFRVTHVTPKRVPRSRKDMIAYLAEHGLYDTAGSWNQSTSYARCIKISRIDFPDKATEERAWDVVGSDNGWWYESGIHGILHDFDERYNHSWQIGTNGRSGGYLVLYQGGTKPSGYKSHCNACGQLNYAKVLPPAETPQQKLEHYILTHWGWMPYVYPGQDEVKALGIPDEEVVKTVQRLRAEWVGDNRPNVTQHNQCGRCQAHARVNFEKTHMQTFTWPCRGTDMGEDFAEWTMDALRERVSLVLDFDRTCDEVIKAFIAFCAENEVVEEVVMVPTKKRLTRPIGQTTEE